MGAKILEIRAAFGNDGEDRSAVFTYDSRTQQIAMDGSPTYPSEFELFAAIIETVQRSGIYHALPTTKDPRKS